LFTFLLATEFFLATGLMPESLKSKIRKACDFSTNVTSACVALVTEYQSIMGNVDYYNIYGDCISGTLESELGKFQSKIPAPIASPNNIVSSSISY
jgi:hypothetical protein